MADSKPVENSQQRVRGIIRDALSDQKRGALPNDKSIRPRCKDCMHFKGTAHPAMGRPCHELGVPSIAVAPNCYSPDVSVFRPLAPRAIEQLALLVAAFTPQQARVFNGLMRASAGLEKTGYTFMQKVFFTLGRGEVLSQYYSGWVFAAGPDQTIQVVGRNTLRSGSNACTAVLAKSSLLTLKQFKAVKARLIQEGFLDEVPRKLRPQIEDDDYEPPSIDQSAELLEARAAQRGKKAVRPKREQTDHIGFDISQDEVDKALAADDGL